MLSCVLVMRCAMPPVTFILTVRALVRLLGSSRLVVLGLVVPMIRLEVRTCSRGLFR